jgi:hypothetical protein
LQHLSVEKRDLSLLDGDEDMERAVQKAINYEDDVIGTFKITRRPYELVREQRLIVGLDEVTAGFPDTLVVSESHAALIDFKFGAQSVTPSKDNLQAIAYTLAVFEKYPQVKTVDFHFYAPYQGWSPEEQRLKYVYQFRRDEVPKLELRVRTVIDRKHEAYKRAALDDWSYATPKHNVCLWCGRRGVCRKVAALVIQANEKYHDLEVPEEVKEYRLTRPEQVAVAWRFASQLDLIIKAIKKRCVDASVTEDLKPEGFIIVKQQKRSVKNVAAVLNIAEEHGLPREEALELLSVPITEFENALKAKAVKGAGAAKVRAFAAELAESGVTELGNPIYFLREVKTPAEKQQTTIDI